jgi:hypothetical protein
MLVSHYGLLTSFHLDECRATRLREQPEAVSVVPMKV